MVFFVSATTTARPCPAAGCSEYNFYCTNFSVQFLQYFKYSKHYFNFNKLYFDKAFVKVITSIKVSQFGNSKASWK